MPKDFKDMTDLSGKSMINHVQEEARKVSGVFDVMGRLDKYSMFNQDQLPRDHLHQTEEGNLRLLKLQGQERSTNTLKLFLNGPSRF